MDALLILTTIIHMAGQDAFAFSFSAKSISEDQKITVYNARKNLKILCDFGLVYRQANRYMFTMGGWNIANDVIAAANRVTKYNPENEGN